MPSSDPAAVVSRMAAIFDRLRSRSVRVHAITSPVAAERTANTLLALGATPTLTVNPEEVAGFISTTDAVLLNLGMLDPMREQAVRMALDSARIFGKPIVLDPVMVNLSDVRTKLALDLLRSGPTVLKTNIAEATLSNKAMPTTVRAISGANDMVMLGTHTLTIANGNPMAQRVTAMGCALGAVIAAFLAVDDDALLATATAMTVYGIAGDIAGSIASGPGSFASVFLDALAALDGETLIRKAKIQ